MVVPIKYRKSGETAIASFDWVDLASGTGYITYFGGSDEAGYVLSNNAFYSNAVATSILDDGVAYSKILDLDFDVLFNLPQVMRGDAIVSVPVGMQGAVGVKDYYIYYIAKVRKWDGATETEIASTTSTVWDSQNLGIAAIASKANTVTITIPQTNFKKGETLRLTIEVYAKQDAASNGFFGIGHDPKNRNDVVNIPSGHIQVIHDDIDTVLEFQAPFRVDI